MTLHDFDQLVRAHDAWDGGTGFADTVTGLWETRQSLNELRDASALIQAQMTRYYETNQRATGTKRLVLKTFSPTTKYRVSAADIKAHDAKLWEASRVRIPRVTVKTTSSLRQSALSGYPDFTKPLTLAALAKYRDLVTQSSAALKSADAQLRQRLLDIGDLFDWDGDTRYFDGWEVRSRVLEYSDTRLLEIAPDTHALLARHHLVAASPPRVVFEEVASDSVDELDEIDGD